MLTASPAQSADRHHPASPVFSGSRYPFTWIEPVEPMPTAALPSTSGPPWSVARARGKVVILNFWATWCAACVNELEGLERFAATADPAQFEVVAVSIDGPDDPAVGRFVRARGLSHLHVLLDPAQRLGALRVRRRGALTLIALPTTYVVDPSGGVVGSVMGPADWGTPQARRLLQTIGSSRAR